jgi:hypothetical protein
VDQHLDLVERSQLVGIRARIVWDGTPSVLSA